MWRAPGVTIILEDSSQANVTGNEADYLIHDNDLLSVINELRSAGAEAISLNGERILATSEVRCTGAVVTVNGGGTPRPTWSLPSAIRTPSTVR